MENGKILESISLLFRVRSGVISFYSMLTLLLQKYSLELLFKSIFAVSNWTKYTFKKTSQN